MSNGYDPAEDPGAQEEYRLVEAPKKKKKSAKEIKAANQKMLKHLLISLGTLLLLFIAYQKIKGSKSKRGGWVIGYPPIELSAEQQTQAEAMGKAISTALSSGQAAEAHALTQWAATMNRIEKDVTPDMLGRNELRRIINEQWAGSSPGIFRRMLLNSHLPTTGVLDRVEAGYVRMVKREGYAAALIRTTQVPNRVEYHEVLIYPMKDEGGKLRVIDIFDRQTGVYASDRLRWVGVQEESVKSDENAQWLGAFGDDAAPHVIKLKGLISQDVLQNGGGAYETIRSLPEPFRSSPNIYAMELYALRNILDDKKKDGLNDTQKARWLELINKPATPVDGANTKADPSPMLAELLLLEKRYTEAEEVIRKLHTSVKDGYLKYLISTWRLEQKDLPGAEKAFLEAKAESPGLAQLFAYGKVLEEAKKAAQ